ncbi:MAG: hypothetical protein AAGA54_22055 [Myxococcota bacterium]
MPWTPLFEDDRAGFFAKEGLFIAVWHDAPRIEQMRQLGECGRTWESAHGPAALMNIAADGVPKFAEEVRRMAAEYTRDPSLFQVARAHVVLMSGFAGVAVRAFINTFLLLGSPPRPTRMASSVDTAAQFLAPHMPAGWDAAAIESTAREAMQAYEAGSVPAGAHG